MSAPPFDYVDPCPFVGIGTKRKFTGDEIQKAYDEGSNNGRSHSQGVLAVLKLLFGDDLSKFSDAQLGSLIDRMDKDTIDNLISDANKEGGSMFI